MSNSREIMADSVRTILVTGATRGVGAAIARRLLNEGYRVIGTGRGATAPSVPRESDGETSHPFIYRTLDLGRHESLSDAIMSIHQEFGPLYGLVNNAALAHDGVLATLHDSQIAETIHVNVTGTILLTKAVLRSILLGGQGGRIINISSIVAHTGFNGLSVYGAAKAAMNGFTRSLAREVGRMGITVNSVAPGYMKTDMSAGLDDDQLEAIKRRSPLHELVSPEDVAETVAFLLSAGAARITGTVSTVDAGSTA